MFTCFLLLFFCFSDPQTAPSEVDGVNLEEIREFAKAFKIRRLSLGLTQTQVGQALSATEGPAYSQSAICRLVLLRNRHAMKWHLLYAMSRHACVIVQTHKSYFTV